MDVASAHLRCGGLHRLLFFLRQRIFARFEIGFALREFLLLFGLTFRRHSLLDLALNLRVFSASVCCFPQDTKNARAIAIPRTQNFFIVELDLISSPLFEAKLLSRHKEKFMELNSAMPSGTAKWRRRANYFEEDSSQEEIPELHLKAFAALEP